MFKDYVTTLLYSIIILFIESLILAIPTFFILYLFHISGINIPFIGFIHCWGGLFVIKLALYSNLPSNVFIIGSALLNKIKLNENKNTENE